MNTKTTPAGPSEVIPFAASDAAPATAAAETPATTGYAKVRFNALKHGILSRHAVLAHEDHEEFSDLLAALVAEHQPTGPTEAHLVEELASAIWRKRRVLQSEGATINRGLLTVSRARHDRPTDPDGPARAAVPFELTMANSRLNHPAELAEAVRQTPAEAQRRIADAEADLMATLKSAEILRRGGARAYKRALGALTEGCAQWWANELEDEGVEATAECLTKFLASDMLPFCRQEAADAQSQAAVKAQTLGEGLQAHRLEKLNRYETHLDRKFERALAMLLKLKELRRGG